MSAPARYRVVIEDSAFYRIYVDAFSAKEAEERALCSLAETGTDHVTISDSFLEAVEIEQLTTGQRGLQGELS